MLIDNGRTKVLADPVGPRGAALHPLLGLPERVPGLRDGSAATPTARSTRARSARSSPRSCAGTTSDVDKSLPYASTLCGACFDVCPVRIPIPDLLVHLRHKVVDEADRGRASDAETRR